MHVDEEQLQRVVDDELAEGADEWVREHIIHCGPCRDRVSRAKIEQDQIFALLGDLDHARPRVEHTRVMERGRTRDSSWMRKAAGFIVAVTLAGAAYAAPGSPLRSLSERLLSRGQEQASGPVAPAPMAEIPALSGISVAPGNRIRIGFAAAQDSGEIRIRLTGGSEIEVRAVGSGASFTTGEGTLEVENTGSRASFEIAIPRHAPEVDVRVGVARVFYKNGDRIVTDGTTTDTGGYMMYFASVQR